MESINNNWIDSANIIKHNGTIMKKTANSFQVRIQKTNGHLEKKYYIASFKTQEEAFTHLKMKNIEFGITSLNRYRNCEDYYEIELKEDIIMKIDKDDLHLAEQYALCVDHGYCRYFDRNINKGKRFHNLLLNFSNLNGKIVVDHINGDRCDNRKSNLRIIDQSMNVRNSKQTKTSSQFIGVTQPKNLKTWSAKFMYKGSSYRQGKFKTAEEASQWLLQKMREIIPEQELELPNRQIV